MISFRKSAVAALAVAAVAASTLAFPSSAEARWGGHGGWRGGGFGVGAGIATGLALGAATGAYYGGYGYPAYGYGGYGAYAYDPGYGGCEIRRRVRYTPYGPVVHHVRICY